MGKHLKSIIVVLGIFLLVIFIVDRLVLQPNPSKQLAYSAFYDRVVENQIKDVKLSGSEISGTESNGDKFTTTAPSGTDPSLIPTLRAHHVTFSAEATNTSPFLGFAVQLVPFIAIALVLVFILRQAQSGGSQALSFGRSRAKLLSENRPKVTFADVAGIEEAKEELGEVVEFLKYPKKFQALGARIPKGVLLLGPPGSGKTLLARAIAGEAGVPFFSISGSDFVEMFVGVGASRVRDLFEQAKKVGTLHRVHRRDRRGRPPARRRPRRRSRRARTNAEPVARRDGRLRSEHRRHPDRRDQSPRRARSGAAASGPLRPSDRGRPRRRQRAAPRSSRCTPRTSRSPKRSRSTRWPNARRASPAPISRICSTKRRCWRRAATRA